ncbi:outer membrane beta-barrel protein, partial [Enterobacter hormaechei]|nr:outer membrane beta-barrel protein [Enterobacter hormaechei]
MAQYYFGSKESSFRPYVGVGLNYTTFFNEKFNGNSAVKDNNLHSLDLKDSWGVAGQVGLDYELDQNWMLNASVWWVNIETDVKFKAGDQQYKIDTRLDP